MFFLFGKKKIEKELADAGLLLVKSSCKNLPISTVGMTPDKKCFVTAENACFKMQNIQIPYIESAVENMARSGMPILCTGVNASTLYGRCFNALKKRGYTVRLADTDPMLDKVCGWDIMADCAKAELLKDMLGIMFHDDSDDSMAVLEAAVKECSDDLSYKAVFEMLSNEDFIKNLNGSISDPRTAVHRLRAEMFSYLPYFSEVPAFTISNHLKNKTALFVTADPNADSKLNCINMFLLKCYDALSDDTCTKITVFDNGCAEFIKEAIYTSAGYLYITDAAEEESDITVKFGKQPFVIASGMTDRNAYTHMIKLKRPSVIDNHAYVYRRPPAYAEIRLLLPDEMHSLDSIEAGDA